MRPETKLHKMRRQPKQQSNRLRFKNRARLTEREVRAQHRLEVELASKFAMEEGNEQHNLIPSR